MELLEFFYTQGFPRNSFLPRDIPLSKPPSKLLLKGVKFCGKRSILYYLAKSNFKSKEVLFIDCADLRFEKKEMKGLESFIKQNSIELLCVSDYKGDFELNGCKNIWVSSLEEVKGFEKVEVRNLSFKEFLKFEKKKDDPKVGFNLFLKNGNSPKAIFTQFKERVNQEILQLTFMQDLPLFKEFASFQGYSASVYFIFSRAKEKFAVSKDRFYSLFEKWQQEGYIYAIEKWGAKRSPKKLFFYNFLVKPLLFTQKEFPKVFENMVFLELKEECFYLEPLGFYVPSKEKVILSIPFGNEVRIQSRIEQLLAKNKLPIKQIEVVTVGSRFKYEIKGVECEVFPFYEWALKEKG
ncbi:MAG: ATP-binding protein [Epsilonproteobacteria bacterium]|nr:ATP-binding protein [Campylobacterota bacterium]